MAVATYVIGTMAPNSTTLRERHVDAEHPDEAAIIARIERSMRPDASGVRGNYRAVRTSGVHRLVRPSSLAPAVETETERGWLDAWRLIDDADPPTVCLPAVRPDAPAHRSIRARALLWIAGHLTWGRVSWRLIEAATRLIVPGEDQRLAFLACAVGTFNAANDTTYVDMPLERAEKANTTRRCK